MSKKTSTQKRTPGSLHPAGSASGVSRQRRWQIKQMASNKCLVCGKPAVKTGYCIKHAKDRAKVQMKWRGTKHTYKSKWLGSPPNDRTERQPPGTTAACNLNALKTNEQEN